ncbi:MAG: response regulator [Nitrospirae bacterium]|nr:response regulator [Nitrospirota bacterium]MBF0536045.1 response regulator [Nitrospirota bacterium]MBF0617933.1 response regulator [Nitrospirota bacterium]
MIDSGANGKNKRKKCPYIAQMKVLIVDDESDFATALSERLQLRGYEATAVFSAQDGFAAFTSNPPDIVFLDVRMPGVDGIAAFNEFKKINPDVEIVLISGQLQTNENLGRVKEFTFDFLVKPVDINDIIKKIKEVSARKNAAEI